VCINSCQVAGDKSIHLQHLRDADVLHGNTHSSRLIHNNKKWFRTKPLCVYTKCSLVEREIPLPRASGRIKNSCLRRVPMSTLCYVCVMWPWQNYNMLCWESENAWRAHALWMLHCLAWKGKFNPLIWAGDVLERRESETCFWGLTQKGTMLSWGSTNIHIKRNSPKTLR
jgi:hypothetical protein